MTIGHEIKMTLDFNWDKNESKNYELIIQNDTFTDILTKEICVDYSGTDGRE